MFMEGRVYGTYDQPRLRGDRARLDSAKLLDISSKDPDSGHIGRRCHTTACKSCEYIMQFLNIIRIKVKIHTTSGHAVICVIRPSSVHVTIIRSRTSAATKPIHYVQP
jgi:hypothetical protein